MTTIDNQIWDPDRIHVLLIGGRAGSGKSTLAGELVRTTGFSAVDKDLANVFSEALLIRLGSTAEDRQSETYVKNVRPIEYDVVKANVLHNVALGNSVIVDAPFGKEFADAAWRSAFEQECHQKAAGKSVVVHYVAVHVDDEVLKRRLIARNEPRDRHKLDDWDNWIRNSNSFQPLEPYLGVDCSKDGMAETKACALHVIEALHLLPPAFPVRRAQWEPERLRA